MSNYVELAKQYSKAGYSVIPTTSEKIPAIRDWSQFQTRPMNEKECEQHFSNCFGFALYFLAQYLLYCNYKHIKI